jgi:hypothetical protein
VLISKKQFDRYVKLAGMMDTPRQRDASYANILIAGFLNKDAVPDTLMADMWRKNLDACADRTEPTPERKLVSCFMQLVGSMQDSSMFSRMGGGATTLMKSGY